MPKTLCKGVRKDGTPCQGNGLPRFDGYCIAHAPAEKTHRWRSRGGKASATAAKNDKRLPERLRNAIQALAEGIDDVRDGELHPAAFTAMCRGARVLVDLYRLADQEMELIRNQEAQAAAAEVAGGHGDLAILDAAAAISARQHRYRIESLVDQGLVTLDLENTHAPDQPHEPVLTDAGRRRLGYQRLTVYAQADIDQLQDVLMRRSLTRSQLPVVLRSLTKMRASMQEAIADLARHPLPARDALTGHTLAELPAGVKVGPLPAANPSQDAPATKILADQLLQVKELTREFKEMYEDELLDDELHRLDAELA